jgi:hypothetical protein
MGGLDCEVDVVESVDTAVEAEGAVESAEVVVGAEVSVGASVAVDVEEVSEDVVGAEVVGMDELSDGTSDADVEAPKTVPDGSEEGAVSETGAEALPNESSPALATPSLISAIYEHLDLPDPRQLRPCRNARAWQMVVRR